MGDAAYRDSHKGSTPYKDQHMALQPSLWNQHIGTAAHAKIKI
jgi:hypothetical protein